MPQKPKTDSAPPTARREFLTGITDEIPLMFGVVPFGVIFGVLGVEAGLDPLVVFFMSSNVFGGASQIVFVQLVNAGAGGLITAATVGVVNLRHAIYSARMAEYLKDLPWSWKIILSYLLTDEAFFVSLNRMENRARGASMHYHLLGAGLTLWVCWQVATLAGVVIGEAIPPALGLGFAIPLTFLALIAPLARTAPAIVALAVSAAVALLAKDLSWNLWLIAAAFSGMAAGYIAEGLAQKEGAS